MRLVKRILNRIRPFNINDADDPRAVAAVFDELIYENYKNIGRSRRQRALIAPTWPQNRP